MKRLLIGIMALVVVSGAAFADTADVGKNLLVKSFQFKHKQADQAAVVIKPLMSSDGSMSIQPSANSLIVTDLPENIRRIAAAIAQYDAPAQPFRLTVRLVSARREKREERRIDPNLGDVASNFAFTPYDVLEAVGNTEVAGREGEPGLFDLGTYRADFRFGEYDPASDSLKVSDLRVSRLEGETLTPMLKTTLNLKLGRTVILGVTKQAQSQKALFLILTATR